MSSKGRYNNISFWTEKCHFSESSVGPLRNSGLRQYWTKFLKNGWGILAVYYILLLPHCSYIWDKVFRNVPSKICERQPLKNVMGYGLLNLTISLFFLRLSSTNFTWSILEYFVQFQVEYNFLILNKLFKIFCLGRISVFRSQQTWSSFLSRMS